MSNNFVSYKNSRIHYCTWGSGLKLLFCFHGYGEEAGSFAILKESLGKDYTLIAVDMPFHGKTEWNEGLFFTADDLLAIMAQIAVAVQPGKLLNNQSAKYSLFGYSMGGRVALYLLQTLPECIEAAVFVAPDGLHKNFWYRFATQSLVGNKIFKYFMYRKPTRFSFLQLVEKLKLVRPSLFKVIHYYTDDEKERHRLYCRWTTMRKFKPNPRLIKKVVKERGVPVRFLFGRFDSIILSSRADIFKDDTRNIQIHVIDAGHRLLQEKYAGVIAGLLAQAPSAQTPSAP